MKLHPGLRLMSQASSVEVIVVRCTDDDVDLRCGGVTMVERADDTARATGDLDPERAEPILLGKRYTDADETIELLCTAGGDGQLSLGTVPLEVKAAKPLPSSD